MNKIAIISLKFSTWSLLHRGKEKIHNEIVNYLLNQVVQSD